MAKRQAAARIDERLFDEFSAFCDRAKVKQEGVIEAAIYWLMHRLSPEQFITVMHEASDYVSDLNRATDADPGAEQAVEAAKRGLRRPSPKRGQAHAG
jgi:hypothetical protein